MHSGIEIPDCCRTEFEAMKMEKKCRCIVYTIEDDDKKVQIKFKYPKAKECDQKQQYHSILEEIKDGILNAQGKGGEKKGRGCYAVWDLKMPAKKGADQETDVLVFMGICFDDLRVKQKMLHASTLDALKKKLDPGLRSVNVTCMAELDYDEFIKKAEEMRK